jgi:hypothetical protein
MLTHLIALLPVLPFILASPTPENDKRFLPFHYPTSDIVDATVEKREPYLPFHVPIVHTDAGKRQHHPELEVRQDWLAGQVRGVRRKFEKHLHEREKEIMRRDEITQAAEMRKRATGTVQSVHPCFGIEWS